MTSAIKLNKSTLIIIEMSLMINDVPLAAVSWLLQIEAIASAPYECMGANTLTSMCIKYLRLLLYDNIGPDSFAMFLDRVLIVYPIAHKIMIQTRAIITTMIGKPQGGNMCNILASNVNLYHIILQLIDCLSNRVSIYNNGYIDTVMHLLVHNGVNLASLLYDIGALSISAPVADIAAIESAIASYTIINKDNEYVLSITGSIRTTASNYNEVMPPYIYEYDNVIKGALVSNDYKFIVAFKSLMINVHMNIQFIDNSESYVRDIITSLYALMADIQTRTATMYNYLADTAYETLQLYINELWQLQAYFRVAAQPIPLYELTKLGRIMSQIWKLSSTEQSIDIANMDLKSCTELSMQYAHMNSSIESIIKTNVASTHDTIALTIVRGGIMLRGILMLLINRLHMSKDIIKFIKGSSESYDSCNLSLDEISAYLTIIHGVLAHVSPVHMCDKYYNVYSTLMHDVLDSIIALGCILVGALYTMWKCVVKKPEHVLNMLVAHAKKIADIMLRIMNTLVTGRKLIYIDIYNVPQLMLTGIDSLIASVSQFDIDSVTAANISAAATVAADAVFTSICNDITKDVQRAAARIYRPPTRLIVVAATNLPQSTADLPVAVAADTPPPPSAFDLACAHIHRRRYAQAIQALETIIQLPLLGDAQLSEYVTMIKSLSELVSVYNVLAFKCVSGRRLIEALDNYKQATDYARMALDFFNTQFKLLPDYADADFESLNNIIMHQVETTRTSMDSIHKKTQYAHTQSTQHCAELAKQRSVEIERRIRENIPLFSGSSYSTGYFTSKRTAAATTLTQVQSVIDAYAPLSHSILVISNVLKMLEDGTGDHHNSFRDRTEFIDHELAINPFVMLIAPPQQPLMRSSARLLEVLQ